MNLNPLAAARRLAPALVAVAAVSAVAATTAGVLVPAQASPSGPSGVTAADLPTVDEVDDLYPYLEGGSREVVRARYLDVARDGCFLDDNGVRAQSVRWSFYPTASGETGFFLGEEDPSFFVHQFGTRAKAQRTFDHLVSYVDRCDLPHSQSGTTKRVREVRVPELGDRQLGYRTRTVLEDGDVRNDIEVYVLRGRRIERSWIQLDDGKPSRAHAIELARILQGT